MPAKDEEIGEPLGLHKIEVVSDCRLPSESDASCTLSQACTAVVRDGNIEKVGQLVDFVNHSLGGLRKVSGTANCLPLFQLLQILHIRLTYVCHRIGSQSQAERYACVFPADEVQHDFCRDCWVSSLLAVVFFVISD